MIHVPILADQESVDQYSTFGFRDACAKNRNRLRGVALDWHFCVRRSTTTCSIP